MVGCQEFADVKFEVVGFRGLPLTLRWVKEIAGQPVLNINENLLMVIELRRH